MRMGFRCIVLLMSQKWLGTWLGFRIEDFPVVLHIQWILFISAREIASALWHIVIEWKAWWDAIAKLSECCNFLLFITGHDFSPVSNWSYLQTSPNISKNYDLTYCDWMESKVGCKTFYLLWLSPQCTTATAAVQPSFSQIAQECTRYHQSTTLKFSSTVFPGPGKLHNNLIDVIKEYNVLQNFDVRLCFCNYINIVYFTRSRPFSIM